MRCIQMMKVNFEICAPGRFKAVSGSFCKARRDVQGDPAHFDDEVVRDDAETLDTQAEPEREGDPGDDQQQGELSEVRVTHKGALLPLASAQDLATFTIFIYNNTIY